MLLFLLPPLRRKSNPCLDARDVIRVESDVGLVSPVEGRHQRGLDVRVGEAQGVAELVCSGHDEVCAAKRLHGPIFLVIKMSVASEDWKEGVG